MVVRFGQFIPTGQAVETTEVVSQLDPKSRKVWYGMAGKRFWSVRFSRMMVVRFDSDQPQVGSRARVGMGSRARVANPSGAAAAEGVRWTPRAAVAQAQDRPALGMAAERSRRGEMAQDDDTCSRCGFSALEAESCLPQIPHWHGNMPPNQRKRKNYYAGNMVPPL